MEFKILVVVFNVAVLSISDGAASIINNDKVVNSYFLLVNRKSTFLKYFSISGLSKMRSSSQRVLRPLPSQLPATRQMFPSWRWPARAGLQRLPITLVSPFRSTIGSEILKCITILQKHGFLGPQVCCPTSWQTMIVNEIWNNIRKNNFKSCFRQTIKKTPWSEHINGC